MPGLRNIESTFTESWRWEEKERKRGRGVGTARRAQPQQKRNRQDPKEAVDNVETRLKLIGRQLKAVSEQIKKLEKVR